MKEIKEESKGEEKKDSGVVNRKNKSKKEKSN